MDTVVRVVATPGPADVRRLVGLAIRGLRRMFLAYGVVLTGAGVLGLADGDPGASLAGFMTGIIGLTMLIGAAGLLRWRVTRRVVGTLREPRTYEIDAAGIAVIEADAASRYAWTAFTKAVVGRQFVLLGRRPGQAGLVLIRSAFRPEEEARLMALLAERGLLRGAV